MKRKLPFKKKPATGNISKLQSLRNEVRDKINRAPAPIIRKTGIATEHLAPQRAGTLFPDKPIKEESAPMSTFDDDSDEENETSRIAQMIVEASKMVREKRLKLIAAPRQTVMDESLVELARTKSVKASGSGSTLDSTKPVAVRDMKSLYRHILSWECPHGQLLTGLTPPGFDVKSLKKIPTFFHSAFEYADVLEPLLLVECWQQFVRSSEESQETPLDLQLRQIDAIDDFHGSSFSHF
ncbi:hypothetical protein HK096_000291 [Nowakowskiella sp. JEL0078]|nr:hypothetical protein HK096_000291 [Nowakowskiella sp. JEL0078]